MQQVNIAEAKARLSELIQKSMMGEEIIIARDNKPMARLVPIAPHQLKRTPGSGKGQVLFIADDFDTIPKGFEDYTK